MHMPEVKAVADKLSEKFETLSVSPSFVCLCVPRTPTTVNEIIPCPIRVASELVMCCFSCSNLKRLVHMLLVHQRPLWLEERIRCSRMCYSFSLSSPPCEFIFCIHIREDHCVVVLAICLFCWKTNQGDSGICSVVVHRGILGHEDFCLCGFCFKS